MKTIFESNMDMEQPDLFSYDDFYGHPGEGGTPLYFTRVKIKDYDLITNVAWQEGHTPFRIAYDLIDTNGKEHRIEIYMIRMGRNKDEVGYEVKGQMNLNTKNGLMDYRIFNLLIPDYIEFDITENLLKTMDRRLSFDKQIDFPLDFIEDVLERMKNFIETANTV